MSLQENNRICSDFEVELYRATLEKEMDIEKYEGDYEITPSDTVQILNTREKVMSDNVVVKPIPLDTNELINVSIKKGETYIFDSSIPEQEIQLSWQTEDNNSGGLYFKNGATQTTEALPYTIKSGYNQIGTLFLSEVIADAYNNKGDDEFGTVYVLMDIEVGDGDSITYKGATIYTEEKESISSPITTSGKYYMSVSAIVSANGSTNKPLFTGALGNSKILSLQAQSKPWINENNTEFQETVSSFIDLYPSYIIGSLGFGETLSSTSEEAEAIIVNNDDTKTINQNTESVKVTGGNKITVIKGTLDFSVYVQKDINCDSSDKLDKYQGVENAGKFLCIDEEGFVKPIKKENNEIIVKKHQEIVFPDTTEKQDIKISWEQETENAAFFANGAQFSTQVLPMIIATSNTQCGTLFLQDVISKAYDTKGNDTYGSVYGLFTAEVSEGDSLSISGANCYDTSGNIVSSPITKSGSYYFSLMITSQNGTINRFALKSDTGTSQLISIQAQTKYWAKTVAPDYRGSIEEFIKLFPYEILRTVSLNDNYVPQKNNGAEADIFADGVQEIINEKADVLNLKARMKILVKKGTLKIHYPVTDDIKISEKKWCNVKWACIGDSYTDTTINTTYKYEQIISDKTGINVQMLGVGGTGWWKGFDTETSYRFRAAQVLPDTDIITVFGSINDWKYYQQGLEIGNITDKLPEHNTLCAYINDTFDVLEETAPTAQIIVFSPMYYHGLSGRVQELYDAVKNVTENRGYEFVDMLHTGWLRIESNVDYATKYCTDYSTTSETFGHPNNLAHKTFIAPIFFQHLKKYIDIT